MLTIEWTLGDHWIDHLNDQSTDILLIAGLTNRLTVDWPFTDQ